MADNTKQFEYIVTIKEGFASLYRGEEVFVAGDLLWYPVEGDNKTRIAPDILVAKGRPPGHRGSYKQWEEDGKPPDVVFEILSPGNRFGEMTRKFQFHDRHGVGEYYLYDPDRGELSGWVRNDPGKSLEELEEMEGWTSPSTGVTFHLEGVDLALTGPGGRRFLTYAELEEQRDAAQKERDVAKRERDAALEHAKQAEARAARLEAKLRELER